ncbi:hypothetical protein Tco_1514961 [Tanacetum coccineum]
MSLYSIPYGSTSNTSWSACPRYHTIGRCNNYVMLQSIPCSPECKIVGHILLDHPLSYALTATADFMLDTKEYTYTMDMFWVILHLPVETPENPFIAPVNFQTIEAFMNRVGYQGVVDKVQRIENKAKTVTFNDVFAFIKMLIPDEFLTEEICATDDFKEYETVFIGVDVLMNQPQPVVSTQGTHRSTPRAHRTPTVSTASPQGKKRKQIVGESSSPRKSQKVTIMKKKQSTTPIPPPGDDRERDEVAEATILSLTLHKTTLAAEAQENIAKVQEKLDEEEIEKMVEGDEDEESYASVFVDSMINDDVVDDSDKNDEEIEKEKKHDDDEKTNEVVMEIDDDDDDVEKVDEGVKDKHNADIATGSMEFRKEKMQTPIPSPIRSPRKVSSSDKTVIEELTDTVSPTTATTSKDSSTSKRKKRSISYKAKILPGSITGMCRRHGQILSHIKNKFITHDFFMGKIREVLDQCNKVMPELTFAKTNEMINKEMPRLVNLAVNKDCEVDPINAQEMISKEFATHAPKMIEELF